MNKILNKTELCKRLMKLEWMFFDVDGVLTDGSLYYGKNGEDFKVFNSLDGHGIKQLFLIGVRVGIISGRDHPGTRYRAKELGIDTIMVNISNKLETFSNWTKEKKINPKNCGHMGDDIADLDLLNNIGFSASVPNAVQEVKNSVHYISESQGGKGAVREVCDLILEHHE